MKETARSNRESVVRAGNLLGQRHDLIKTATRLYPFEILNRLDRANVTRRTASCPSNNRLEEGAGRLPAREK